ncbi:MULTISPECIES: acyltransferase [unclassified Pseudomonas]|uniref:acyltransferase family protein n=1 Tax=unclassified Pseudomonas TaxID=196821 RepID=UPI00244B48C5|nr:MULTISPECIES: acyltransferase [unclassified Pseudomonas]MDH0893499.1 acyltransferase [Pseudomonas sp. GD03875]MDH1063808.1 acyltransferase [Pseudomonas sp. GD03985]
MRSPETQTLGHIACFDGLRALAAILIVAFHAAVPALPGGFLAVDVFFVLSGFLITRMLVVEFARTGTCDYRAFVIRRLRRLWPALLFMLMVYLLVAPWIFSPTPWWQHWRDAVMSAVYLVNYASFWGGTAVLRHTWSLAVEMQFYLLWPLLLLLLLRLPRYTAITSMLSIYVGVSLWRCWSSANLSPWGFYPHVDAHSSGLILGSLLGYLNIRISSYWSLPAILLLVLCVTFFSTGWQLSAYYGFTLAEIGAGMLLLARPGWLGNAPLAWLGRMSYGLYLWHYPVMRLVQGQGGWDWPEVLLLGVGLGLLFAVLSHYLLERRFYKPSFHRRNDGPRFAVAPERRR